MRIKVYHETVYNFTPPAKSVLQVLRLTPRNFDGQHISSWRIDVDTDCHLVQGDDAFGNITHTFSTGGPISRIAVLVEGEIQTIDTNGILHGTREPFPPNLYLRQTDLTSHNAVISEFAARSITDSDEELAKLHSLMKACHDSVSFDPNATGLTPSEALAAGKADCVGMAHLFIAGARLIGAPARCVSGYLLREEPAGPESLHVWAEAHVPGFGWIGFDPALCLCPGERHIRVACALDHLGAAPVRSAHAGSGEAQKVDVRVVQAQAQWQWQS